MLSQVNLYYSMVVCSKYIENYNKKRNNCSKKNKILSIAYFIYYIFFIQMQIPILFYLNLPYKSSV